MRIPVLFLFLLAASGAGWSTTLGVGHQDRSPYPSITAALAAASKGDQILVSAGVYSVTTGETFPLAMKTGVALLSGATQGYPEIHGSGVSSVLAFNMVSQVVVDGFRITGGKVETIGAGLTMISSSPVIRNCTIIANQAGMSGAGIHCSGGGTPLIENCLIVGNSSGFFGGGAHCENGSSPLFRNCSFISNQGGGVSCLQSSPRFMNCRFLGNTAVTGGGVYCAGATLSFSDCVVVGNHGRSSSPSVAGGIFCTDSRLSMENCLICGNSAVGDGGGIITDISTVFMSGCALTGNSSMKKGGGLLLTTFTDAFLNGCILAGNMADEGGAFLTANSTVELSGCVIRDNTAVLGAGFSTGQFLIEGYHSQVSFANSIVHNGTGCIHNKDYSVITMDYTNMEGGYPGSGNQDSEPLFEDGPEGTWIGNEVFLADTYQTVLPAPASTSWQPNQFADGTMFLLPDKDKFLAYPIAANTTHTITVWGDASNLARPGGVFRVIGFKLDSASPCIDSGSNDLYGGSNQAIWSLGDYQRRVRAADGNGDGQSVIDRGALEFGTPPIVGDTNGDGSVNILDLFQIHLLWKSTLAPSPVPGDQNGDQIFDARDLLCFLRVW